MTQNQNHQDDFETRFPDFDATPKQPHLYDHDLSDQDPDTADIDIEK